MIKVLAVIMKNGVEVKRMYFSAPSHGLAYYNASVWAENTAKRRGETWKVTKIL